MEQTTLELRDEDHVIAEALQILEQRMRYGERTAFTSPEDSRHYLSLQLAEREREVFAVLYLDNRHRLIAYEELFYGTIDGAAVHPRELVKAALKHNASAVIVAHNHPSGIPEPSQADKHLTQRLREALALVDLRILDHIVVGGSDTVSFAERGLI